MISNDLLFHMLCEFGSTALMIVFGVGVHCDTVLKGTKYQGSGHMFAITTWSFGISVCLFVFGGAVCMNPAMVLAQCIVGLVPWASCIPYMVADMLGGFAGACIAWLMYADEFKASEGVVDPIAQRNIFSTNPTKEGTNFARDFFCEAICTFVFKINLFFASVKSDIVDVNTNNISAEQLRFNKRCPTARKLIKHQISFF